MLDDLWLAVVLIGSSPIKKSLEAQIANKSTHNSSLMSKYMGWMKENMITILDMG